MAVPPPAATTKVRPPNGRGIWTALRIELKEWLRLIKANRWATDRAPRWQVKHMPATAWGAARGRTAGSFAGIEKGHLLLMFSTTFVEGAVTSRQF